MKYCPNCGAKVDDGDTFCTSCGSKFPQVNQSTQQTQSTQQNSSDDVFGFDENKSESNQTVNQPQPQPQEQPQPAKTNTYCLLGLVFSFIVAIVGLILSCMGLSQVKNNPNEKGKELAIAGIVISILSMVGSFIVSVVTTLSNIANQLN